MNIQLINMHPRELFKTLEDMKTEIMWARNDTTTPSIKNVHYPKSSLNKKSMTHRTALWVFIKALRP
jgi:hypothetical protein